MPTPGPHARARDEIAKVVVGQEAILLGEPSPRCWSAATCCWKAFPGVTKTLLVKTLAEVARPGAVHPRPHASDWVCFRPRRRRSVPVREGPVFTDLSLADEINRTPPCCSKQGDGGAPGHRGGCRPAAPEPLVVVATENPVDGGHLSAARGAAGPVHVQADRRVPDMGTGDRGAGRHHRRGADPRPRRRRVPRGRRSGGPRGGTLPRSIGSSWSQRCSATWWRYVAGPPRDSPSVEFGVSPRGATALLPWLEGLGVAVGQFLRQPRRGQGGGQADPAPPPAGAPGVPRGGQR